MRVGRDGGTLTRVGLRAALPLGVGSYQAGWAHLGPCLSYPCWDFIAYSWVFVVPVSFTPITFGLGLCILYETWIGLYLHS